MLEARNGAYTGAFLRNEVKMCAFCSPDEISRQVRSECDEDAL